MDKEEEKFKSPQDYGVILSALEIHNREFKYEFRGYNTDEVNEFLDQIIKDYEAFGAMIRDLRKQIIELQHAASPFQDQLSDILQRLREVEIHCWGKSKE